MWSPKKSWTRVTVPNPAKKAAPNEEVTNTATSGLPDSLYRTRPINPEKTVHVKAPKKARKLPGESASPGIPLGLEDFQIWPLKFYSKHNSMALRVFYIFRSRTITNAFPN